MTSLPWREVLPGASDRLVSALDGMDAVAAGELYDRTRFMQDALVAVDSLTGEEAEGASQAAWEAVEVALRGGSV